MSKWLDQARVNKEYSELAKANKAKGLPPPPPLHTPRNSQVASGGFGFSGASSNGGGFGGGGGGSGFGGGGGGGFGAKQLVIVPFEQSEFSLKDVNFGKISNGKD